MFKVEVWETNGNYKKYFQKYKGYFNTVFVNYPLVYISHEIQEHFLRSKDLSFQCPFSKIN